LPPLVLLNGKLGHRLIERLHEQNAFALDDTALEDLAKTQTDELFQREGAVLLRTGMGLERSQVKSRLVHSVLALARTLRAARLRIVAIEKPLDATWRGAKLEGRIDLLVVTADGVHGIIDFKSGLTRCRRLLESGRAVQLAVYAFAHATEHADAKLPDAAYFSLKQSHLLGWGSGLWPDAETLDGPSLEETWQRIERSVPLTERVVEEGRIPVAGVRRALPLLDALGINEDERGSYIASVPKDACEYCDFKALCGHRWEASA
jgi:hypothetical protein